MRPTITHSQWHFSEGRGLMSIMRKGTAAIFSLTMLLSVSGCAKKTETTPVVQAPPESGSTLGASSLDDKGLTSPEHPGEPLAAPEVVMSDGTSAPAEGTTQDAATPDAPTSPTTPLADPAPKPETAATSRSTEVLLGDPSLTSAIPGSGPLTIEQIQAWLDTPGVNEPLLVSLPLGLNFGINEIAGLEENPLTRARLNSDGSCTSTRGCRPTIRSVARAATILTRDGLHRPSLGSA